jgi:hypothetical protein
MHKSVFYFITSAAIIYLVVGMAKVISVFNAQNVFALSDPIFGIQFYMLFFLAGTIEVCVGLTCLHANIRPVVKLGILAWISNLIVTYRVGLWFMNWHRPCGCMGSLSAVLHISNKTADLIMKLVLVYILIGSYVYIYKHLIFEKINIKIPSHNVNIT